jgi:hypothetical protein
LDHGNCKDWHMPDVQDYLSLASEAHDFAAWTPDPELAASYRRLAGSYHALARFLDQIPAGGGRESRDGRQVLAHGARDTVWLLD